jgi:dipeptidase D
MDDKFLQKIKENIVILSKIPHASGDEKAISNFLMSYAKNRGLEVIQDKFFNLIIKKSATSNTQKNITVILQGHMDMVYVRDDNCQRKYEDGMEVIEENNFLLARGTSLGADNGVALAYMMILMDLDDILHPNLEMVITVEEEVGLAGAEKLDVSYLKGNYLINLDAENEGQFFVSCAGGVRNDLIIPVSYINATYENNISITIEGLKGGHSGLEIDKKGGNAIVIMARLLKLLSDSSFTEISKIFCNGKANTIPNKCSLDLWSNDIEGLRLELEKFVSTINSELTPYDEVRISTEKISVEASRLVLDKKTIDSVIDTILLMPTGILGMDRFIPDLVETSVNIGSLTQDAKTIKLTSSIRSSVESRKNEAMTKIERLASLVGIECSFYNNYPGWSYSPNSPLRKLAMKCYKDLTGKDATEASIHAGLECGYFNQKMKNIDIIAFGPDLHDVHTTKERLDLKSATNIFKLLLEILKNI